MTETTIDTAAPVLVTGAAGYVAGWIVHDLVQAGATVHAAVRDPDNVARVAHLTRLNDRGPGRVILFRADLLAPGSYTDAMAGCGVVFHTASPFRLSVADPQRDLVDPALEGTRNVLASVDATPSVTRVVLTSSVVAMYGDVADLAQLPGGTLTEAAWNTTSALDHQPYSHSKTLAEREAWAIAGAQDRWRLVVINPALVVGPSLGEAPSSESFNILRQMGDGRAKMGVPDLRLGLVDVRDLAQAHLAAGFLPQAEGRHIICGHEASLMDMADALRPRFGADWPLPRRVLPKWLVLLVGPSQTGLSRRYLRANVGHPFRADAGKSLRALGLRYRPLEETMTAMFQGMIDANHFSKS